MEATEVARGVRPGYRRPEFAPEGRTRGAGPKSWVPLLAGLPIEAPPPRWDPKGLKASKVCADTNEARAAKMLKSSILILYEPAS